MWLDVWRHVLGEKPKPQPSPHRAHHIPHLDAKHWRLVTCGQACHRDPALGRRVCARGAIFRGCRGPRSNRHGRPHPEQPLAEHAGHGPRSCRAGVRQRGHSGPPRMDCHEPPCHRRGAAHPSRPVRRLHHGSRVDWKRPKHRPGASQDHARQEPAHAQLRQFRRSERWGVGACSGESFEFDLDRDGRHRQCQRAQPPLVGAGRQKGHLPCGELFADRRRGESREQRGRVGQPRRRIDWHQHRHRVANRKLRWILVCHSVFHRPQGGGRFA